MFDLHGKKALVTGSTQGIGYAIAKCLADYGAAVFVHGGTRVEKTNAAAETISGAIPVTVNLAEADCADKLYALTGDVDIIVLNASVQYKRPWDEITDEEMEKQLAINFKSSVKLIQKYAPKMLEQRWGRIVTVGSVQQAKPHKDLLIYAASKAAQMSVVGNLAKQFAPFGVTVNNIAPGVIDTPRNEEALSDTKYAAEVLDRVPCRYVGLPEDCAGQVLLLCSDAGRYMTGENIYIDGGMKL